MRILHGVNQKKQDRLVFNFICQKNSVNPQQVREDMKEQGYWLLTPSVVTNFIKENY